jgi:hypothetical protein
MQCVRVARGEFFKIERVTVEVHGLQVGKVCMPLSHLK